MAAACKYERWWDCEEDRWTFWSSSEGYWRSPEARNPIYQETAAYGHLGREPQIVTKHFKSRYEGNKDVEVELFTWEKLDYVDKVKAAFGL